MLIMQLVFQNKPADDSGQFVLIVIVSVLLLHGYWNVSWQLSEAKQPTMCLYLQVKILSVMPSELLM